MIASIVFLVLFSTLLAISTTIREGEDSTRIWQLIVETSPGVYSIEDLSGPIPQYRATENDVKFYFSSRDNLTRTQVDPRDPTSINSTPFSPNKDTWFVVHGWKNDYSSSMEEVVSSTVLEKADVNVFCIDWSSIAKKTYLEAFAAVPDIGRITGELIKVLVTDHGLQLNKVYLVGHSLGAHVAGRIGNDLEGKIPLIVGLDPAGPLFFFEITNNRLDPTDAQYVHVIHTCAAILGFRLPLGHADFYVNGGEIQPFCPFDITGSCSHTLSYTLYVESIISGNFRAKSCSSYEDYENGKCDNSTSSEMGGYLPDRSASGTYYLQTNQEPPYAMG